MKSPHIKLDPKKKLKRKQSQKMFSQELIGVLRSIVVSSNGGLPSRSGLEKVVGHVVEMDRQDMSLALAAVATSFWYL